MEKITIDCIIGIDPGKSGGLAIWRPNYKTEVLKMPSNILDLRQYFEYITSICNPLIFLEKVQLRPDDIEDNTGKAFRIQKMLADFEILKTVISVCDIPFVLVNPMKWQNTLKVRVKGEERKDRKKDFKGQLLIVILMLKLHYGIATLYYYYILAVLFFKIILNGYCKICLIKFTIKYLMQKIVKSFGN